MLRPSGTSGLKNLCRNTFKTVSLFKTYIKHRSKFGATQLLVGGFATILLGDRTSCEGDGTWCDLAKVDLTLFLLTTSFHSTRVLYECIKLTQTISHSSSHQGSISRLAISKEMEEGKAK